MNLYSYCISIKILLPEVKIMNKHRDVRKEKL